MENNYVTLNDSCLKCEKKFENIVRPDQIRNRNRLCKDCRKLSNNYEATNVTSISLKPSSRHTRFYS